MTIKTYEDMQIKIVQKTDNPNFLVKQALNLTQTHEFTLDSASKETIRFILDANHTSIFEHCYITFFIEGVSRSFLAQITRHRMASYTASSQHYQQYSGYPHIVNKNMAVHPLFKTLIDQIEIGYEQFIEDGIPKEEARQILPNSKAVNIMWTINARSLINFLNLRLCKRNTDEIRTFARRVHFQVMNNWWPELFVNVGPDCYMKEFCTQGKMSCGDPYDPND